jgi:hypothetical protein
LADQLIEPSSLVGSRGRGVTWRPVRLTSSSSGRAVLTSRGLAAASAAFTVAGACAVLIGPAEAGRLESPRTREIAAAGPSFRDTVLPRSSRRLLGTLTSRAWGGRNPTGAGESVTIYVSQRYPENPATTERWAAYFGGLLHGSELGRLTAYLAPPDEVRSVCGFEAAACYNAEQSLLVAPGENLPDGTSAEAVVAHEYGHHVAANRLNPPWTAVEWGTKRWASYINVCTRARAGTLFPGSETNPTYRLNPGEGFAEAYRVLNERRAGIIETPWEVVDTSLYPDETALQLLEQDVTQPWQANAVSRFSGSLARGSRSYAVTAAYDGRFRVTLRAPARARFTLVLLRTDGTRVAHAQTAPGARTVTAETTVCGQRSFKIRVTRKTGAGSYRLTASRP